MESHIKTKSLDDTVACYFSLNQLIWQINVKYYMYIITYYTYCCEDNIVANQLLQHCECPCDAVKNFKLLLLP